MTKEDTAPGLLSKMVKFVRNPATSWSELDTKESDRDEAVSKVLMEAAWKTFWVTMIGFGISVVVGVMLGFQIGRAHV